MKTGRALMMLVAFWFCLSPLLEGDDGTLPLPRGQGMTQATDQQKSTDDLWDLLCR